jgi:hypothetical protein
VPGKLVTLLKSANNSTWTTVGTYATNASGVATSAAQKPAATTYYRWVYNPTGVDLLRYLTATSTSTKITVLARTTLTSSGNVTIAHGKGISLKALLKAGSKAVGGATLTLQQLPAGAKSWANVRAVRTASNGYASYTVKPTRNTKYRWVFAATSTYAGVTSATTTVSVTQVVTVHATAKRLAHGPSAAVKLYGTVAPAVTGQRVVVQQYKSGRWVTTARAATTKRQRLPNGTTATGYVITVPEKAKGVFRYRIYRAPTSLNAAGYSATVTVTVT